MAEGVGMNYYQINHVLSNDCMKREKDVERDLKVLRRHSFV